MAENSFFGEEYGQSVLRHAEGGEGYLPRRLVKKNQMRHLCEYDPLYDGTIYYYCFYVSQ